MVDELPAYRTRSRDRGQQSFGHTRFLGDAAGDYRGHGCGRRRLYDHPVTGHECRNSLADAQHQRIVPGCDHADDTTGLVDAVGALGLEQVRAVLLVGQEARCVLGPEPDHVAEVEKFYAVGLGQGLAGLGHQGLGNLFLVVQACIPEAFEDLPTRAQTKRRPVLLCLAATGHGLGHLCLREHRYTCGLLERGRVGYGKGLCLDYVSSFAHCLPPASLVRSA